MWWLISTWFLIETSYGRRFLEPTPMPKYPQALQWPITAIDLGAKSGENAYGFAWERSGLFEGDIMTSPGDLRNTLITPTKKWTMPVPVYINGSDFDEMQLTVIEKALTEIEEKTCVQFRQYHQNDSSFVVVRGNEKGCWSIVGRRDGGQVVHLQVPYCVRHGVVVHEFLHALGLHHQQSSPDRDDYVKIHWENIKQGREYNFNKYSTSVVTTYNLTYDYSSVMHYSEKAFSSNGSPTITPLDTNVKIGQRKSMSIIDAKKIQYLYNCPPMPLSEAKPKPPANQDYDLDDLFE